MLNIDGLISGLDTSAVIEGLLQIQQQQVDRFTLQREEVQEKQTAFAGVEARLLGLRSELGRLSSVYNSALRGKTVTSSHDELVNAAAGDKAVVGVYRLRVTQLATAHTVASQGFASIGSDIATGTLDIGVGNSPTKQVEIDGTNNTLQGLADAINDVDAGVTATIINDGSGGGSPYRLLLSANATGANNDIRLTNDLTNGSGVQPTFDLDSPVEAAADAEITLGSGSGAITARSAENQVDGLIPDVTLDLLGADVDQEITLNVGRDTEAATTAINDFVDAYNGLITYIDEQVAFNGETEQAGLLLGDRSVITIRDRIQLAATSVVADVNVNTGMNRLSALGITITSKGKLSINSSRLDEVLSGRIEGVDSDDVIRLFALSADSTHAGISFVLGGDETEEAKDIKVDIISAAVQASVTATNQANDNLDVDASNNTFSLVVDGLQSSEFTLAEGTYTRDEMAAYLEELVNDDPELRGTSVAVTVEDNRFQITSTSYGSTSEIAALSGSLLGELEFDGSESHNGQDVVGKFIVDGNEEKATGRGQLLIGDKDNETTDGLQLRVTLTPSQVTMGSEASLTVTKGIASKLDTVLDELLQADDTGNTTGFERMSLVEAANDRFERTVDSINESIERMNQRFEAQQEYLIRQFTALESTLSELQTTSSFLATQLTAVSSLRSPA